MDKYKKILRLLNEGKTLQVYVKYESNEAYDRLRILHKNKSMYVWIDSDFKSYFKRSCFTKRNVLISPPRTTADLVRAMQIYDRDERLRIVDIKVV